MTSSRPRQPPDAAPAGTGARSQQAQTSRPRRIADLPSAWRPLRDLQRRIDEGIAEVYAVLGVEGVRPRFSAALMFLESGPLSIRELAERCEVTHSAMSQSVAAMRDAGLVRSEPGSDARSRLVSLTEHGRQLVPRLWDEWYATERAVEEVAEEAGVSLRDVTGRMAAALDREPFADRLLRRMRATDG